MRLNKKQLQADINETITLKDLMNAYEELAAIRMKRIREQVVKSRDFHSTLSHYFHEIRVSRDIHDTQKKLASPQDKYLAVLLSDDKGLYGDILSKSKEAFVKEATAHPEYELAVIGNLDIKNIKASLPGREIHAFPLQGGTPQVGNLPELLSLLANFTHITVIHGKFVSLINQTPEVTHLTGEEEENKEQTTVVRQYYLEPSHASLLTFFQKEILSILLEQALLEGTLAKEAARMVSLEKASDEARGRVKKLERLKRLISAQKQNKEQITYLAGLSLWGVR